MLEHEAQRLGFREYTPTASDINSPQQMQIVGFILQPLQQAPRRSPFPQAEEYNKPPSLAATWITRTFLQIGN